MSPDAAPVALITGAAGGIGSALAARLAESGYDLILTDLTAGKGPANSHWLAADIADPADVESLCATTRERFGRLDALIHAAGKVGQGPLAEVAVDDWCELLAINLTSAFLLTKHAYPLLKQQRGRVVLFSSTNALNGGSALSGPAYAAAKAGIINLCRYLAKEWAADGIRVNCVAPGPVDTPMLDRLGEAGKRSLIDSMPLGRLATTADVVAVVTHLLSPGGDLLTGTVHNLSGGLILD